MIRSSSRKVKPTSKFEEFKLTATGKKRGRPRKSWPQEVSQTPQQTPISTPDIKPSVPQPQHQLKQPTQSQQKQPPQQQTPREELLRTREENNHTAAPISSTPVVQRVQTSTPKQTAAKTPTAKPLSLRREELLRLREENANLKSQLEQQTIEFEELKRQSSYTGQTVPKVDYDDLKERYQRDITHAKRNEWCVVCLSPSRYHCCWNTTYCSQKCQVADWYSRHGKSCERRKALKNVV